MVILSSSSIFPNSLDTTTTSVNRTEGGWAFLPIKSPGIPVTPSETCHKIAIAVYGLVSFYSVTFTEFYKCPVFECYHSFQVKRLHKIIVYTNFNLLD